MAVVGGRDVAVDTTVTVAPPREVLLAVTMAADAEDDEAVADEEVVVGRG